MKHLHFVQSIELLQGGGLGKAALALHEQCCRQATSTLVSTRSSDFHYASPGVHLYLRKSPKKFFYAPTMSSEASSWTQKSDILHGHGFYVYPNALWGKWARRYNKPLVYHPQGMLAPWALKRSPWKKRIVRWMFENKNFKHTSLWRALTPQEADQIHPFNPKAPIVIAPNGIDVTAIDAVKTTSSSTPKTFKRLLFLSRIHPKKGLDILIEAWQALTCTQDWELYIAGPNDGGYAAKVKQKLKHSRSTSRITLNPAVEGTEKIALLRDANAFILPSYSEGFSIAILEAMACRLPIIATHGCHFPDIEKKCAGWTCQPTVKTIQAALEQLIRASDQERKARGQAGREIVEKDYRWENIAATITDACNSVV